MRNPMPAVLVGILAVSPVAQAADLSTTDLEKQLADLRQSYEKQEQEMKATQERLHRIEAYLMSQQRTASERTARPTMVAASSGSGSSTPQDSSQDTVVRDAPASRSAESVYQEQHALFDRRFTLETSLTYARSDRRQLALNGFLALDAIFLGNISVDEVKSDIWTLDVTGRYTINDRLQADLDLPFLYRSTNYLSGGAGNSATSLIEYQSTMSPKLGDVSAGVYYQLQKETEAMPDIILNVRAKAPTGTNPYGISLIDVDGTGNLNVPSKLPSGNGVWALSTGLTFVKTVDPAILFANVGYFYNFQRSFGDIDSAVGAQPGTIKLGDSFQYGLGTAFALNDRMSLSISYSQRFTAKAKTRLNGHDWQEVVGSDANAASLNFGVTYAMNDHRSLVANVAAGLTPDAPDLTVGIKQVMNF